MKYFVSLALLILVGAGCTAQEEAVVTNFDECVAAGNPVMESYPRQCQHGEETFTEEIELDHELDGLIRLHQPLPGATVSSPLQISGEARGTWYFEGDFPIVLVDWDGLIVAEGFATAQGEWMTEDFVPFEGELEFEVAEDIYSRNGTLILQKDNPSGLPEHDAALEVPIIFE